MIRGISKFDLTDFHFIQGIEKATACYYLCNITGQAIDDDLQFWYLPWSFKENTIVGNDHLSWLSTNSTPVSTVKSNAEDKNQWFDFSIPASDIDGFIKGTKNNYGFTIHGATTGIICEREFYAKEYSVQEYRPKLTIIYDMPFYAQVITPRASQSIRPDSVYQIIWYSNSNGPFNIELLKNGNSIDTIATNVLASPYNWNVPKHAYNNGSDYSIRISDGTIVSSNNPIFEIVDFVPKLTVKNGTGSGIYAASSAVAIKGTNPDPTNKGFIVWRGDDVSWIEDTLSENTKLTMPDKDLNIEAVYDYAAFQIPGKLEAEDYQYCKGYWSVMSGEDLDGATVAGNYTYSDSLGFWISFRCNIQQDGNYRMDIRAAHEDYLNFLRIEKVESGSVLGRFELQGTQGSNELEIHSNILQLYKGEYTLRFYVYGDGWFGLDYIDFSYVDGNVAVENNLFDKHENLSLLKRNDKLVINIGDSFKDNLTINIYNVNGRKVATLFNGNLSSGINIIPLKNAYSLLASGYYICTLESTFIRRLLPILKE